MGVEMEDCIFDLNSGAPRIRFSQRKFTIQPPLAQGILAQSHNQENVVALAPPLNLTNLSRDLNSKNYTFTKKICYIWWEKEKFNENENDILFAATSKTGLFLNNFFVYLGSL